MRMSTAPLLSSIEGMGKKRATIDVSHHIRFSLTPHATSIEVKETQNNTFNDERFN